MKVSPVSFLNHAGKLLQRIGVSLGLVEEKDEKYPSLSKKYVAAVTKLADEKTNRRFLC